MVRSVLLLPAVAATLACCASAPDVPKGVGYVHVTRFEGSCNLTQAVAGFPEPCPPSNFACSVDRLDTIHFTRAHAVAAFQGGSRYPGGQLVVVAWKNAIGTISRLYLDFGPTRGYGTSVSPPPSPNSAPLDQATGYTEWAGEQPVFQAKQAFALYHYDPVNAYGDSPKDSWLEPGTLHTLIAFDGTDASGEAQCVVVGVHGEAGVERTEPYDPAWLKPNATLMMVDGSSETPSYAGDAAPTHNLVTPKAGMVDPGGAPPRMGVVRDRMPAAAGGADSGCD